jgi:hypothetical protein
MKHYNHIHKEEKEPHMSSNESIIVMIVCMVLAGTISGMNSFVNKIEDIRLNINDVYMSFMMIGLMFIFMSIYYQSMKLCVIGFVITISTFILIRKQIFVNEYNFLMSMIPHHSMAVMMSSELVKKKLKSVKPETEELVENIIRSQKEEIELMKKL